MVRVIEKETHIKFELISLTNKDNVDLIQWDRRSGDVKCELGSSKKFMINSSNFKISSGKNNIIVDCSFDSAESNAKLKVELRTSGEKTRIVYHNKL